MAAPLLLCRHSDEILGIAFGSTDNELLVTFYRQIHLYLIDEQKCHQAWCFPLGNHFSHTCVFCNGRYYAVQTKRKLFSWTSQDENATNTPVVTWPVDVHAVHPTELGLLVHLTNGQQYLVTWADGAPAPQSHELHAARPGRLLWTTARRSAEGEVLSYSIAQPEGATQSHAPRLRLDCLQRPTPASPPTCTASAEAALQAPAVPHRRLLSASASASALATLWSDGAWHMFNLPANPHACPAELAPTTQQRLTGFSTAHHASLHCVSLGHPLLLITGHGAAQHTDLLTLWDASYGAALRVDEVQESHEVDLGLGALAAPDAPAATPRRKGKGKRKARAVESGPAQVEGVSTSARTAPLRQPVVFPGSSTIAYVRASSVFTHHLSLPASLGLSGALGSHALTRRLASPIRGETTGACTVPLRALLADADAELPKAVDAPLLAEGAPKRIAEAASEAAEAEERVLSEALSAATADALLGVLLPYIERHVTPKLYQGIVACLDSEAAEPPRIPKAKADECLSVPLVTRVAQHCLDKPRAALWRPLFALILTHTLSARALPGLVAGLIEHEKTDLLGAVARCVHDLPEPDLVRIVEYLAGQPHAATAKLLPPVLAQHKNNDLLAGALCALSPQGVLHILRALAERCYRSAAHALPAHQANQLLDWTCAVLDAHCVTIAMLPACRPLVNTLAASVDKMVVHEQHSGRLRVLLQSVLAARGQQAPPLPLHGYTAEVFYY